LERVEERLSTTHDKKRMLEVNLGDAVAQIAQDRLRIEALKVSYPCFFPNEGRI
jgi:hypothetical protein